MNRTALVTMAALGLAALLSTTAVWAHERATTASNDDPAAACTAMMQGAGDSEQGRTAMREFMQSPRAPQAMASMMAMAHRMGNGDVTLGMTRMMEMMGGGMMGGAGMMTPGHEPEK